MFTKTMTVQEVLEQNPKTADVFKEMGMHCLGCPSAAGESLAGAARTHNMSVDELLKNLNAIDYGEMSAESASTATPIGAVVQRDKKTFAIAPHTPGGLVSVEQLRKIADVAEKYNAKALKMTGAGRMAIVGIEKEDVPKAWDDLGMDPGHAVGICVRSVKFCPGTTFCKRGEQDAVGMGMELDKMYHGMKTPGKMKMAVSGCPNNCAEPAVRDIGVMGTPKGWNLMVGGTAGFKARLGDVIANHLTSEDVMQAVSDIMSYYQESGKKNERLGEMIDRIGLDTFKEAVLKKMP